MNTQNIFAIFFKRKQNKYFTQIFTTKNYHKIKKKHLIIYTKKGRYYNSSAQFYNISLFFRESNCDCGTPSVFSQVPR